MLLARLGWAGVGSSPRVRGILPTGGSNRASGGSSPRVRGILKWRKCNYANSWFIPAGAGNTRVLSNRPPIRSVHTRGCGEYVAARKADINPAGSSPRVRGIRGYGVGHSGGRRFIPAGAGNTRASKIRIARSSVHPRGCGEYTAWSASSPNRAGSSPRVRGIRRRAWRRLAPSTVHPRGCGEYPSRGLQGIDLDGSSPRVRGIRVPDILATENRLVHPRGCGEYYLHASRPKLVKVHPRGCGEYT